MSLVGKIFAVLCLILAVFYAGITAALVSLQENYKRQLANTKQDLERKIEDLEKNKLKSLQNKYDQLFGEHDLLQKRAAQLLGENHELRSEWQEAANVNLYAKMIIEDQEEEVKRLVSQRDIYSKKLTDEIAVVKKREEDITGLTTQVKAVSDKRDEFSDLLTRSENRLLNAEKELRLAVEALSYRQSLLDRLKEQRPDMYDELVKTTGTIVIVQDKPIRGKVVAVDTKLGLVIINAGQRHGVKAGYPFILFRGSEYIGKVLVEDVPTPDACAARYIKNLMRKDAEVGDDATTKLAVEF